jgi:hypothetical protein
MKLKELPKFILFLIVVVVFVFLDNNDFFFLFRLQTFDCTKKTNIDSFVICNMAEETV